MEIVIHSTPGLSPIFSVRNIRDFIQRIYAKTVFSTIVAEEDIPKTAITKPFGLYEFLFMTFGLRNSV